MGMRVMEVRKTMLGQEHPDTLAGMANLASTESREGLEVPVIEVRKTVLGQEHLRVWLTWHWFLRVKEGGRRQRSE